MGSFLRAFAFFGIYFAGRAGDNAASDADDGVPILAGCSKDQLCDVARRAIELGDRVLIDLVARESVRRFSGFESGRPVAGTYYAVRTLR